MSFLEAIRDLTVLLKEAKSMIWPLVNDWKKANADWTLANWHCRQFLSSIINMSCWLKAAKLLSQSLRVRNVFLCGSSSANTF